LGRSATKKRKELIIVNVCDPTERMHLYCVLHYLSCTIDGLMIVVNGRNL